MTEVFNKYVNGKIYKIFNTLNDDIYVGSTIQSLSHRMIKHRDNVKNTTTHYKTSICTLMQELGVEHFFIELVEDYPCKNKEELNAREGYWIKQIANVNKQITGRTPKEHYEDNKERIMARMKEYKKQYRQNEKDKIKEYLQINKDKIKERQRIYNEENKDKIREQQKLYNEIHKDKLKEYFKEYNKQRKNKLKEL